MNRLVLWSLLGLVTLGVAMPASVVFAQDDKKATEEEKKEEDSKKPEEATKEKAKDDKAEDKAAEEKEAKEKAKAKEEAKKKADAKAKKEKEEKAKKKSASKRKTFTVKPKPFKSEITVSGVLVAEKMSEVKLEADQWSKFEVDEVVSHGARVRVGETLIRFDDENLNEAISNLEISHRIGELSMMKMEQEFPRLEEALQLRLKNAQRNWDEAQADYKEYTDKERDLVVKSQKMRLKNAKFNLDFVKDELEQLKKMYEADDLTEETEEMILRRQKSQYEFAKFSYEISKYSHARTMGTMLPRQDQRMKEAQRSVELSLERAKMASELDLSRARYELEKARIARRKAVEKHSELIADKRFMTIKSPAAGIVYYGRCIKGKWGEISSLMSKLQPEKFVPKGATLMTIVNPGKMTILSAMSEKDVPTVELGQPAKLKPTAAGADPIDAKVTKVGVVPIAAGRFELELQVTGQTPEWLMPGMTGKATITTYDKKDALLVPTTAVHTDEQSGKKFVWVVEEEDDEVEVEKEWVKTGKTKGKEVEIVRGVDEGDVLSLDPKEKGTEDDDDDDED